MERTFVKTDDGSVTIRLPEWGEQYHSKHGAIAEARHVFINAGLRHFLSLGHGNKNPVAILEIGFGTGLNALLSLLQAKGSKTHIKYVGVEGYPLERREVEALNYPELLGITDDDFLKMHEGNWEVVLTLSPYFQLEKRKQFFSEIEDENVFDLVFFDAFGPEVQPELWTESLLGKMHRALKPDGIFVTYSAKGSVRRELQRLGFSVERLPGPAGKREMLRGTKG